MTDDTNTTTTEAPRESIIDTLAAKAEREQRDAQTKRTGALEVYWTTVRESAADEDATATPEQVEAALAVLGLSIGELRVDVAKLRNIARVHRDRHPDDARKRAQAAQQALYEAREKLAAEEQAAKKRAEELRAAIQKADVAAALERADIRTCREEIDAAGKELAELMRRGYVPSENEQQKQLVELGRFEVVADRAYVNDVLYRRGQVAVLDVSKVDDDGTTFRRLADGEEPAPLPNPAEEMLGKMPPGMAGKLPRGSETIRRVQPPEIVNPRLDMPAERPAVPVPEVSVDSVPESNGTTNGVEVLRGDRLRKAREDRAAGVAKQRREERSRSRYREDR